jgi:hypothetical protein
MTNPQTNASLEEEIEWAELNNTPRYPRTLEGWRGFSRTIEVHSVPTKGAEDFDFTINPFARANPLDQMRALLDRYPLAFLAASRADLTPVEWRLLRYIGKSSLARLGQPDFDPKAEMIEACLYSHWVHQMPSALVGSNEPTVDIARRMEQSIAMLPDDQAKAVWAILAFTWAIPFDINEVYQLPWWDYQWLVAFVGHARAAA